MDSRKVVFKETGIAAAGVAVGVGLMLAVCGLLGYFSRPVWLGGAVGGVFSVLNFFFMSVGVNLAADRAAAGNVKSGKTLIRTSYFVRLALLFLVFYACAKSGLCEPIPLVVPLILPRLALTVAEFFRKEKT